MFYGAKPFLFLALFVLPALAQGPLPECLRGYAELSPNTSAEAAKQKIREGEFTVTRNLAKYKDTFGTEFERELDQLGPHGRWLNGGGGKAIAEKEFLVKSKNGKVVSLVYERPHDLHDLDLPESSARFQYMEGRMIEDVPDHELGKFKIITDFYGPLAYTRDFSGVLQKYLNLLEDHGSLYFTLERDVSRTQMVARNGEAIPLREWIESIPGLQVEVGRVGEDQSYRVTKLAAGAVKVPPLETVHYSYSMPPSRLFNADAPAVAAVKTAHLPAAAPAAGARVAETKYPPADPGWLGHAHFKVPTQQKNKFYQLRTSTERDDRLQGAAYEQLIDKLDELGHGAMNAKLRSEMDELRERAGMTAEEFHELLSSAGIR